jgi:hypothetical protein
MCSHLSRRTGNHVMRAPNRTLITATLAAGTILAASPAPAVEVVPVSYSITAAATSPTQDFGFGVGDGSTAPFNPFEFILRLLGGGGGGGSGATVQVPQATSSATTTSSPFEDFFGGLWDFLGRLLGGSSAAAARLAEPREHPGPAARRAPAERPAPAVPATVQAPV